MSHFRCNFKEVNIYQASNTPDFEGTLLYLPPSKPHQSVSSGNVFAMGRAIAGKAASKITGAMVGSGGGGGQKWDGGEGGPKGTPYWFKLKANMLFYFKDLEETPRPEVEPTGLLILEQFHLQRENMLDSESNSFSIIFADNPLKVHTFTASDKFEAFNWERNLRSASFLGLQHKLRDLQARLGRRLEQDPLAAEDSEEVATSKLLTSSTNQIAHLNLHKSELNIHVPPQVVPRKKKGGGLGGGRKGFIHYTPEDERPSRPQGRAGGSCPAALEKPTFKVHADVALSSPVGVTDEGVAVGTLLDI